MKLSDYVFKFLSNYGVKDIFMLTGGGCMHLVDSLGSSDIRYICCHHEQSCAMAAEAYAKYTNTLGVALVTTGCGGTNAITGCLGAYQDSAPCLFISGQTKRAQTIYNSGIPLRQFGAQEANIIPIVSSITKYSVMVNEPQDIRYHLEKAVYLATTGRHGSVWLDIPLDIQATQIDENNLKSFKPDKIANTIPDISYLVEQLEKSERPVLVCGNGIKTGNAKKELRKFAEKTHIPIVTSMIAVDVLYTDHPNNFGVIGTKGTRAGNFAVQNADLVISLGCRLSVSTLAHEYKLFARQAKIIVVDIDPVEHQKKTIRIDNFINCDVKILLKQLNRSVLLDKSDWLKVCQNWKSKYPVCLEEYRNTENGVNFYNFVDILTRTLDCNIPIVTDAGSCFFVSQGIVIKEGQSYITSGGLATMGFSLPASIGVGILSPVVVITGDGSFQLNIQELQTIKHNKIPAKIFVLNNNGYLSIRNTQKSYFNSRFVGESPKSGVSFPNLKKIAEAYEIPYFIIEDSKDLLWIEDIINYPEAFICEVMIVKDQQMIPSTASYLKPDGSMATKPMEDMYPFLDREEFKENMIIPVVEE